MAGLPGEAESGIGICQDYFVILLCVLDLGKITTRVISHSPPAQLAALHTSGHGNL